MAQINKPSTYFNTILYTGDGASSRTITGLNFSTDLIWYKRRNAVGSHRLIDTVRGIDKNLATDLTNAENTEATYVTAINSDGWSIGSNTDVNNNGTTMAVWNWRASDSSAVSNTDGSITSSVSANTTAGFSIVSYTGTGANANVGHGLGVAPSMIIFKNRDAVQNWVTYHSSLGGTKAVFLDTIDAQATSSSYFNNTSPTSSLFYIGASGDSNGNGQQMIAYCFAEKKGFSKFGSYTGNGSTDGTFVYTGFKPAMVISKKSDGIKNWYIWDNKREPYNDGNDAQLYPNLSNAEDSSNYVDFLSNGFKLKNTGAGNDSGGTYIYMAFAESPLVGTNNIPTTAR